MNTSKVLLLSVAAVDNYSTADKASTAPVELSFSIPTTVFLWIIIFILALETIVGNVLVIAAYHVDRTLRQPSNLFIISLAVSDLVIGIEGFPLLTVYVVYGERWLFGRFFCNLWLTLDYTLGLVSILTVLLITVDRYCCVCKATMYRQWQSKRKVCIMIAVSWLVPICLFSFMIFGWEYFSGSYDEDPYKCYAPFLSDPYVNLSMYLVYYWATLVAMIVLYRGIHRVAASLQAKAKAKERQAVAMAALQQCMAKMGVGIMAASNMRQMQEERQSSSAPQLGIAAEATTTLMDSGFVGSSITAPVTVYNNSNNNNNTSPKLSPHEIRDTEQHSDYSSLSRQPSQVSTCSLMTYATARSGGTYTDHSYLSMRKMPDIDGLNYQHFSVSRLQSAASQVSEKSSNSITIKYYDLSESDMRMDHIVYTDNFSLAPSVDLVEKCDDQFAPMAIMTDFSPLQEEKHFVQQTVSMPLQVTSAPVGGAKIERMESTQLNLPKTKHKKRHSSVDPDLSISASDSDEIKDAVQRHYKNSKKVDNARKPKMSIANFAQVLNPAQLYRRRKKAYAERRAKKAFRTITIILGAFVLFWSPYFVFATFIGFCEDCIPSEIFLISYYMCYLNSSINPFCYALANRQFRKAFIQLLRGHWQPQGLAGKII